MTSVIQSIHNFVYHTIAGYYDNAVKRVKQRVRCSNRIRMPAPLCLAKHELDVRLRQYRFHYAFPYRQSFATATQGIR